MLGGDILHAYEHVLITSAAVTRHNSNEAFRPSLQLERSIEDRRACLQILQSSLQKLSKDGKLESLQGRTTSISQVDELPISGAECDSLIDFSAALRALLCRIVDPKQIHLLQ